MQLLRNILVVSFVLFLGIGVQAEELKPADVVPVVNGEVYSRIARVEGEEGVTSLQYIRPNEDFKTWTSTVIYANYRIEEIGDDPQKVAVRLVEGLQALNPGAKYQLVGDENGKVVLLDFLSWPPNRQYMELSVYRIQKDEAGEGVFTVQMSVRMPFYTEMTDELATKLKTLRGSLLQQTIQFDMKKVISLLKSQRMTAENGS